jgi:hypothetical protein
VATANHIKPDDKIDVNQDVMLTILENQDKIIDMKQVFRLAKNQCSKIRNRYNSEMNNNRKYAEYLKHKMK